MHSSTLASAVIGVASAAIDVASAVIGVASDVIGVASSVIGVASDVALIYLKHEQQPLPLLGEWGLTCSLHYST